MQPQSSLLNVSVTWRGKKFVVEMNIGANVKDLGQELQKLTNINEDTMRFIIPQISGRASKLLAPFSAEHAVLSLQEASITELNPPAAEALKRMHMLAADPGIVAVMNKHRWRVGIMTEMAPVGYVGVDPKCILGFNKNHGEEISLRLRTDDLNGFRKYESIKKTLLHELAHMVYSEHDANFYALDKQLNQEASSLDWTRSASHTLSGVRNTSTYEDNIIADKSSIPQKLGGNRTDQLISARESSVAAAHHRLANVSPNKLGGSELNQELDPGYSSHSLSENKSDCMISASKEIEDIEMAVTDNKEYRGEPDPDDHIINGMNHEPDPDDSHHGKVVDYDVSSEIADRKTSEQPNDFGVRQVLYSETSTGNMVASYTSISNQDTSEASTESIAPIIETVPNDVPTPELSTLQTNEPDPDDQEFQRINDTSTAVCNRLLKAVEMLRREVSAMQATSILHTLLKIIRNVIEHPLVEKYKRLRKANPIIERNILNNKAALEILFLVGFSEDVLFDNLGKEDAYLVLKRNDPGLLWLAKSTLESSTGLAC
ncbi:uncharacterized protein LOC108319791 isoform X4 [Vigna angularis]|uniref:uncharacterized protein LOC108319791 isoform X4 n=1 Tax=Phaseolus angularis TaxID=3914 RepID=UPI0022B2FB84|nr:uncharacterized protein LOC108319791 isoform X4 [Vigna angularis]